MPGRLLAGTSGRPRRARRGPRSHGRWRAPGSAGPRRSRTSACRRGRRDRGAGRVSGALRARSARISGSTGSAAMTCSHLGHSVLPTMTATGEPMRQAVPHAAEEGDLVPLELHPGTAAIAEPPPGQVVRHHLRGDRHAGGKSLQRRDECGSVGLPRGQPAQPAQRCSSCSRLVATATGPRATADRCAALARHPRSSHVRGRRPGRAGPRQDGRVGTGRGPARQRRASARSPARAHRAERRRGAPGHLLDLEHRLVHQQVEAADDRPAVRRPGGRELRSARGRRARRRGCRAARGRRRRGRPWYRPGWWR